MFTKTFPVTSITHALRAIDWLALNCQPLTIVRSGSRAVVYASPDAPNVAEITIRAHPYADTEIIARVDQDATVILPALSGAIVAENAG